MNAEELLELLEEVARDLGIPIADMRAALKCQSSCAECVRCTATTSRPGAVPAAQLRWSSGMLRDLVEDYDPDSDPYIWDFPSL